MFFVLDENHNLIEAYDKEGILAVLSQAIKDGSLSGISADAGFVSKLRCCVGGDTHPIAFVSQAEYNELQARGSLIKDCIYYITDDTTAENIDAQLKSINDTLNGIIYGVQVVPKAENANHAKQADEADSAKKATVLMPTALQPNGQGGIPITESGVYIVCIQDRNLTDYTISFLTDMIAVANLNSSSVSIKGSGGVAYDKSTKSLTVGGSTAYREYTIAYAYRLC